MADDPIQRFAEFVKSGLPKLAEDLLEGVRREAARVEGLRLDADRKLQETNVMLGARVRSIKDADVKLADQATELGTRDARIAALIEQEAALTARLEQLNASLAAHARLAVST